MPTSNICVERPIKDPICLQFPSLCIVGKRNLEQDLSAINWDQEICVDFPELCTNDHLPIFTKPPPINWETVCDDYPEACINGQLVIG